MAQFFPTFAPTFTNAPTQSLKVQGLIWLDENANGLYDSSEPGLNGVFANLRACDNDQWVATTTSNEFGQYRFEGLEVGEYYVEFFKPNPFDRYEFTLSRVAGDDDTTLDSDVILDLDGNNGRSGCIEVQRDGFNKLTNAGFISTLTTSPFNTFQPTSASIPWPWPT